MTSAYVRRLEENGESRSLAKQTAKPTAILPKKCSGSPAWTRTKNQVVNSHLLYQLSYWGMESVLKKSNYIRIVRGVKAAKIEFFAANPCGAATSGDVLVPLTGDVWDGGG